jgi:hypothetical protein
MDCTAQLNSQWKKKPALPKQYFKLKLIVLPTDFSPETILFSFF